MSANLEDPAVATELEKVNPHHSSPMLVRTYLESCMLGVSIMGTKNFQMSKLGFKKEEELEIKLPAFARLQRKQGDFRKNISLSFINYAEAFDCVDHDRLWKALREMGIPDHLTCLMRNLYLGQEATVRTLYRTLIGSHLRKVYDRAACCYPVCLTYTLGTSWEMPGWMSNKLESRQTGEKSTTSDIGLIPL